MCRFVATGVAASDMRSGARGALSEVLALVRAAHGELESGRLTAQGHTLQLLQHAAAAVGAIPGGQLTDVDAFRSFTALRADLGASLLAAEQLAQAGVAPAVINQVLRRGADNAERVLIELVESAELSAAG